jgi:programmed cell death 6-interacting protein
MLAVHCKRTDNVDLKGPILTYIRETYSDIEANEAVDDLAVVQQLRNEIAAAPPAGSPSALRDSLCK